MALQLWPIWVAATILYKGPEHLYTVVASGCQPTIWSLKDTAIISKTCVLANISGAKVVQASMAEYLSRGEGEGGGIIESASSYRVNAVPEKAYSCPVHPGFADVSYAKYHWIHHIQETPPSKEMIQALLNNVSILYLLIKMQGRHLNGLRAPVRSFKSPDNITEQLIRQIQEALLNGMYEPGLRHTSQSKVNAR
ncbi:hypothetical protein BT96DRAFT_942439 [Gymnopus androsaceus JB14]|uniref:Uncharacterized protein n=1 Tax=Gymnopus androsaceus JB14 TaxID=1447944 RepID=A0A6A4HC92_9AGAR|nr:hypothetical protein BT96DRAFT_942439 [Gymnopus androsaceus JB14]